MDEKILLEELSHGNIHLMKIVTQGMLLYLKSNATDLQYVYNLVTQNASWLRFIFPLKSFKDILTNVLNNIESELERRDPCGK